MNLKQATYFLVIVFLSGACSHCFSQDKGVNFNNSTQLGQTLSEPYANLLDFNPIVGSPDTIQNGYPLEILGRINNNYYADFDCSFFNDQIELVKYDNLLRKANSAFIFRGMEDEFKDRDFEKVLLFGKQLFMFTTGQTKTQQGGYANNLYVEPVNNETLKSGGKKTILENNIPTKAKAAYFFELSPDSSRLAVVCFTETANKDTINGKLIVVDKDFNILWQSPVQLPYRFADIDAEEQTPQLKMMLRQDGKFYILAPNSNSKVPYCALYTYTNTGNVKKIMLDEKADNIVKDVQFYFEDKHITFTGLYIQNDEFAEVQGTFFYRYNLAVDSFELRKLYPDSGIDNRFSVYKVLNTEDGGSLLVLTKMQKEKYPKKGAQAYSTTEGGGSLTSLIKKRKEKYPQKDASAYLYQDIVALKRNAQGQTEWKATVPSSINRDKEGIVALFKKGRLFTVFSADGKMYISVINNDGSPGPSKPIWYNYQFEIAPQYSAVVRGKMMLYVNRVSTSPVKVYGLLRLL